MRKIFILIAFCLLAASVSAYDNSTIFCVDESTSMSNITLYNASNNVVLYASYEPTTCQFGCNGASGECNPSPYDTGNMVLFIMPIISFILLYFTNLLKEEDWAIHILLMSCALAFLIVPMGVFSTVLSGWYLGAYQFLLAITVLVIAYYMLKVIVRSVEMMRMKR